MYAGLISSVVIFDNDLLRNIKGIRESQELFDDLTENPGDFMVAYAAESRDTEPTDQALISRPFDYGMAITFPFIQANWQRTRFSAGNNYGAWYGSLELETTIYESAYHWRRFVLDSFSPVVGDIIADRRVVKARCRGILVSLLGKEIDYPALIDPDDYAFTNELGAYMKNQNQNGLLVRSARCLGTNAALFTPSILNNACDHCFLTYTLTPSVNDTIRVEREPGKLLMFV
ncbi:MAG: RES family NAD+ phosphorylase [Desulfuromonadales bacterium]